MTLALSAFLCLFAQVPTQVRTTEETAPETFIVERIALNQGVVNDVTALHQDRTGFLWIGTTNGLYRYHGLDFKAFESHYGDDTTLSSNHITTIFEGKDGTLWIGTHKGLNEFIPEDQSFYRLEHDPENPNSLGADTVNSVIEDPQGRLWIAHPLGVDRHDPLEQTFVHYNQDNVDSGYSGRWGLDLFIDPQGVLWASSEFGLNRYNDQKDQFELTPLDYTWECAFRPSPTAPFDLLLGKLPHRFNIETGRASEFEFPQSREINTKELKVNDFFYDKKKRVWMATPTGVVLFDPGASSLRTFRHNPNRTDSLSFDEVTVLLEDRSGVIWAGTSHGLNKIRLKRDNFSHHSHNLNDPASLVGNVVNDFLVDSDGDLWVGTSEGLSHQPKGRKGFLNNFAPGRLPDHLKNRRVKKFSEKVLALAEGEKGQIWILCPNSLYLFEKSPRKLKQVSRFSRRERKRSLYHMLYHSGSLWLGGEDKLTGLIQYDPKSGKERMYSYEANNPESLAGNAILAMFRDKRERIWVATPGYINCLTPKSGRVKRYVLDASKPDFKRAEYVNFFYENPSGKIWLGTNKGLRCLLDEEQGRFSSYTTSEGLVNNKVLGIGHDLKGNLWLSHPDGITRYSPKIHASVNYDINDGLNNKFRWRSAYQARDGEIFFGGSNGFNRFNPDKFQVNQTRPTVIFSDFTSKFDESVPRAPIWDVSNLQLGPKDLVVYFQFAVLDYNLPDKNMFSYKLEGYDKKWSDPSTDNKISFKKLKPDQYTLRLRGSNSDGVWAEKEASINIIVSGPFWKSSVALILYIILIPIVFYTHHRYRVGKMARNQARLEMLVDERTHSLRKEKEKTEAQARKLIELDVLKTQFFSNVSHEFRTPLTLIIGPLEGLLDKGKKSDPAHQADQYAIMLRSARRLLRLINQLLDISKLEAGKMKLHTRPGDLATFSRPILAAFQSLADSKSIDLCLKNELAETRVYFDPQKVEKVLFNLLSNALQFTQEGGAIELRIDIDPQSASMVRVSVIDNGVGIPERDLPYIFDRFRQADGSITRTHEGTGIGLSLVKELVEIHAGRVVIESREGEGTEVSFSLPLGTDHLDADEVTHAPLEEQLSLSEERARIELATLKTPENDRVKVVESRGLGESLLVIDDHPDVRNYIRDAFSDRYRILEGVDGQHGLEVARKHEPDLIISDVMMPNMDGYAMCRELKANARLCHIPIILLTAKADDEMKVEGLEIGADDYLSKPFNLRELKVRVRNLLAIRNQERSMRKSLDMAHKAQISMLPTELPRIPGLDIATFCRPAREVGGDYYDFVRHDDNKLSVIIGDVSGKGMPAALYMTMTKGLVQAYSGNADSPKEALDHINSHFRRASDANTFISLLYAVIDPEKGSLRLASAGHNPMIHATAEDTSFVKSPGMAIGLRGSAMFNRVVTEQEIHFSPGDTFVLYTDGITEGMNGNNEVFGDSRLLDLVARNGDLNADDLLEQIKSEHASFVGNTEQFDDMTAVIIKVPNAQSQVVDFPNAS